MDLASNPALFRRLTSVALCAVSLVTLGLEAAPQERPGEYQVKAAYLMNFTHFVKWPAPPPETFDICVLGRNPFEGALQATTAGEQVDGRKVQVRDVATPAASSGCAVVFVSSSEEGRDRAELQALPRGVLTVSDIPRFVQHGGVIELDREGDRIRFQVNLLAADAEGLTLSSELLKVATRVTGARRQP
jgi:hypothetical protein